MSLFHDVQLSEDIEQGAKGGPMFKTTILGALSGREQRIIEWQYPRCYWNVGYGIQDRDGYTEVLNFFYCRQGRAYAFRFKDWTDYATGFSATGGLSAGDNPENRALIGLGTTGGLTTFQLYKYYADAAATFTRKITRPVSGTTRMWVNSVELTATGFAVGLSGGVVTLTVAPSGGAEVEAYYEFDVPVRFDMDNIETEVTWWNAAAIPDINIVEVRE